MSELANRAAMAPIDDILTEGLCHFSGIGLNRDISVEPPARGDRQPCLVGQKQRIEQWRIR